RITVETGRKIDSEHIGALVCAQVIDATTGRANRIAERRLRAKPKQAIKNYQRRSSAQIRLCRHRFLSGGQLFSRFFQKFDNNHAGISPTAAGWRRAKKDRKSTRLNSSH